VRLGNVWHYRPDLFLAGKWHYDALLTSLVFTAHLAPASVFYLLLFGVLASLTTAAARVDKTQMYSSPFFFFKASLCSSPVLYSLTGLISRGSLRFRLLLRYSYTCGETLLTNGGIAPRRRLLSRRRQLFALLALGFGNLSTQVFWTPI
jgi:hypothetical protein